jgi:hypothetical protein
VKEPRPASLAQILCGSKEGGDDAPAGVVRAAAAADRGQRGGREREWGKGGRRGQAARCPGQGTGRGAGEGQGWIEEEDAVGMGERRENTSGWGREGVEPLNGDEGEQHGLATVANLHSF